MHVHLQVTVWIMMWIGGAAYAGPLLQSLLSGGGGGAGLAGVPSLSGMAAAVAALPSAVAALPSAVAAAFEGFTLPVWGVVLLKALNGILIPATFKYADNILYAYAKPSSIVVTTCLSCLLAAKLPSLSLALGVSAVVGSIFLYSSKPKAK